MVISTCQEVKYRRRAFLLAEAESGEDLIKQFISFSYGTAGKPKMATAIIIRPLAKTNPAASSFAV